MNRNILQTAQRFVLLAWLVIGAAMGAAQPAVAQFAAAPAAAQSGAALALDASTVALGLPSVVAHSGPSGLIASTGNLYWTSNTYDEFGPDVLTVWRASKGNVPGSERVLYREYADDRFFGDIVYAYVGSYYGYFVVSYHTATGNVISRIKRVPLAGGPAVVIASSPEGRARDLQTDGSHLYWVDNGGIRRVAIGGGVVTTVYPSRFVGPMSLGGGYGGDFVYFGQDYLIMRAPKDPAEGGPTDAVASTSSRVTALHYSPKNYNLLWGQEDGAVNCKNVSYPQVTNLQPTTSGRKVTSVVLDGYAILVWSDCVQPGNTDCRIRQSTGGGTVSTLTQGTVGVGHLQVDPPKPRWQDPASLFWGDVSYLRRYVR
jgi:hypothetical protein